MTSGTDARPRGVRLEPGASGKSERGGWNTRVPLSPPGDYTLPHEVPQCSTPMQGTPWGLFGRQRQSHDRIHFT